MQQQVLVLTERRLAGFKEQVFLGAVVLQGLHFVEHIAQVIQKSFLGLPEAHGFLGAVFDTEWVHFIYNLALFTVLSLLAYAYGLHRRHLWHNLPGWYTPALTLAAALQGYHLVEHSVKLAQHLAGACASCPGLLGAVVDLTWLHFFINLLVLISMTLALVGFAMSGEGGN